MPEAQANLEKHVQSLQAEIARRDRDLDAKNREESAIADDRSRVVERLRTVEDDLQKIHNSRLWRLGQTYWRIREH